MGKKCLGLLVVVALATVLRVYRLDSVPPALFGDEVDVGYQAYSILKTGKDLYGRFLPIYIKSLSEYRAPLYIYSTVPFVGIFGLNEWGARMPAAFWGVVSIVALYFFAARLVGKKAALFSAALLAISPWHLQYSRASFEVTMLLSFLLLGSLFFILSVRKKPLLLLSAFLFGATLYIYSTAVVFSPLLLVLLAFVYRKELCHNLRNTLLGTLVLLVTVSPALWSIYQGEARGRFSVISIFQESVLLDKINLARAGQQYLTPRGESRVVDPRYEFFFHNKPAIFGQVFTLNYLRAFSVDFLFATGDPNFRHSIHEMGLLYLFELPVILLGLWALAGKVGRKERTIILGWLLLAPIPAALTFDGGFHATRLFSMLVPLTVLGGLGIGFVSTWPRMSFKVGSLSLGLLAAVGVVFYLHRYFVHYPIESWRWWHVGYKEALSYINDKGEDYQTVVINNSYEPSLIRYLFYTGYEPSLFHQRFTLDQSKKNILAGVDGFSLDGKVYFGAMNDEARNGGGFEYVMKPGMLYLASARDEMTKDDLSRYPYGNFTVAKTIFDPAGEAIFYVLVSR